MLPAKNALGKGTAALEDPRTQRAQKTQDTASLSIRVPHRNADWWVESQRKACKKPPQNPVLRRQLYDKTTLNESDFLTPLPQELLVQIHQDLDNVSSMCLGLTHSRYYNLHVHQHGTVKLGEAWTCWKKAESDWHESRALWFMAPLWILDHRKNLYELLTVWMEDRGYIWNALAFKFVRFDKSSEDRAKISEVEAESYKETVFDVRDWQFRAEMEALKMLGRNMVVYGPSEGELIEEFLRGVRWQAFVEFRPSRHVGDAQTVGWLCQHRKEQSGRMFRGLLQYPGALE